MSSLPVDSAASAASAAADSAINASTISTIADWASLISLIGLLPLAYAAWVQVIMRWRQRYANWLSKRPLKSWLIVRPEYAGNMARVEDVLACEHVTNSVRRLGLPVTVQGDKAPLPHETNVVLLCGPKGNAHSQVLNNSGRLPFVFVVDSAGVPTLKEKSAGQNYTSPLDTIKQESDLVLIGQVTEPDKSAKLFLWGLHGLGTLGAAEAFADPAFLHEVWTHCHGGDFCAVLKVSPREGNSPSDWQWFRQPQLI